MEPSQAIASRRTVRVPEPNVLHAPRAHAFRDDAFPVMSPHSRLVVAAALVLLIVVMGLSIALGLDAVQAVTVAVFLLAGLGIAPVLLLRPLSALWFSTLAITTGLATMIAIGFLMSESRLWGPGVALAVAATGTLALLVPSVRRDLRLVRSGRVVGRAPRMSVASPGGIVLGATVLGLAVIAASALVSQGDPEPAGLLGVIAPTWYLGLVLLVATAVYAYRARVSPALPVLALSVAVVLSQAIVYGEPVVMSAARHVGIVDYIRVHEGAAGTLDIYQAWSGLFAGIAWLCDAAGIADAMTVATWWPVLLSPTLALGVAALASRWVVGGARVWFAAAIFALTTTLNITYFSPQSIGLLFAVVIFALAVSPRRGTPQPPSRGITMAGASAGTLALIGYLSLVMAVTHQISPYLAVAALVVLAGFGFVRPWVVPLIVLVPAVTWALLHLGVLGNFVSIGAIGRLWNNVQPPDHSFTQLPRPFVTSLAFYAPAIVLLVVGIFAIVAVIRLWSRPALALFVAAASPVSLFGATDYGQEGIFRVALFAGPWLAVLAAATVWAGRRWTTAAVASALAILAGVNAYGQTALDWNRVPSRDSAEATLFFESTAPDGAIALLTGTGNATPQARTAAYPDVRYLSREVFGGYPDPDEPYNSVIDVRSLTREFVTTSDATGYYAIVSESIGAYNERYGFQSYADYVELADAMDSSSLWKPVFEGPTTTVYELRDPDVFASPGS